MAHEKLNDCRCGCGTRVRGAWKRGHNLQLYKGERHYGYGKHRSPETKARIAAGQRRYHERRRAGAGR